MANQLQPLWEPIQLSAAADTYYTAAARTRVDMIVVANPSATTTYTFIAYWIPDGDTAGAANIIQPERAILPGEAYVVFPLIGQTLNIRDKIAAQASVANVLNFFGSGLVTS